MLLMLVQTPCFHPVKAVAVRVRGVFMASIDINIASMHTTALFQVLISNLEFSLIDLPNLISKTGTDVNPNATKPSSELPHP